MESKLLVLNVIVNVPLVHKMDVQLVLEVEWSPQNVVVLQDTMMVHIVEIIVTVVQFAHINVLLVILNILVKLVLLLHTETTMKTVTVSPDIMIMVQQNVLNVITNVPAVLLLTLVLVVQMED
jgi:hypothetical protein